MEYNQIKYKCKCCITGKSLVTCEQLNAVQLPYKATWQFPQWGNFLTGQQCMAMAFIHDDCINEEGKIIGPIKYAVEISGDKIIYHDVNTLEKEEIKNLNQKPC